MARRTAIAAQQQRGIDTRQRLIDAAVECLTRYGFGGTTMVRVAKVAGVSPGPRQYYFPTREDLFEAVVEYLIAGQRGRAIGAEMSDHPIDGVIDGLVQFAGSREHVAMLEIKLALKHEYDLNARVGPIIEKSEADNDQSWRRLLAQVGLRDDDLVLRRILPAVARGLAFETNLSASQRRRIGEKLKKLIKL